MKQWHLYALLAALVVIGVVILIGVVPGGKSVVVAAMSVFEFLKDALAGTLVFAIIIAAPFLIAMFFRWWVIPLLDDVFDSRVAISPWGDFTVNLLFSLLLAGLWLVAVPWLAVLPTWVFALFQAVSYGWTGVYETLPIWWGVYSFVTYFIGYYIGMGIFNNQQNPRRW